MNWLLRLDTIKLENLYSLKTYLIKHSATKIVLINSIKIMSHFYKAVNYYYNICKSIAARQVYYKVN